MHGVCVFAGEHAHCVHVHQIPGHTLRCDSPGVIHSGFQTRCLAGLRLTDQAGLAGQRDSVLPLSLLHPGLGSHAHTTLDHTQVLTRAWQPLCSLSYLPSPISYLSENFKHIYHITLSLEKKVPLNFEFEYIIQEAAFCFFSFLFWFPETEFLCVVALAVLEFTLQTKLP